MNNTTRFILGIYQVSLMIRDSLEYVQKKDKYELSFYNQRKAYIEHGLIPEAPLARFLSQNGETGSTIRKNLDNFFNDVYGTEATIVSLDGEKLVVDYAQSIKLIDYVVGLHETLTDIEKGFMNNASKEGNLEEELATFLSFDEKYYRAIMCINLLDQIHTQFLEFNKVMRDSNGQPSPASNFVLNDIKKLVGLLKFQEEHANKEDLDFKKAYDATFLMVQMMEGSQKPAEGKTIRDQILEARKLWEIEIGKNEPEWRQRYQLLWNSLVEFEKQQQAK